MPRVFAQHVGLRRAQHPGNQPCPRDRPRQGPVLGLFGQFTVPVLLARAGQGACQSLLPSQARRRQHN